MSKAMSSRYMILGKRRMRPFASAIAALILIPALSACGSDQQSASSDSTSAPAGVSNPQTTPASASAPPAFAQCKACHSTEPGKNGAGPSLAGVFDSKAGQVPGFSYSSALKASDIGWDRATLDEWLARPAAMVPGTTMVISVANPTARKQIIDYLETLERAPAS